MIKCSGCGAEIAETSKFCEYCGKAVETETVTNDDVQTVNENTVTEISNDAQDVNENAVPGESKSTKKIDFKDLMRKLLPLLKKYKKIIICVILVIAIGVGGFLIYDSMHCQYGSCNNASVEGSQYCYNHKCNLCDSSRFVYSNYCYSHYLLYDDDASSTLNNANSDLKFSNIKIEHNSSYTVVTGRVTNNGSHTYKFVQIKGAFKTSSGTVVDTDSTYAVGSEGLSAGESTNFRMSVDKDYSISKCDISIIDYD